MGSRESPPSHPLAIFGNTGAYIQSGRDYVLANSWGWTAFAYPHPLQEGASPSTPPARPANLRLVP
jgi:hypothetical protein